MVKTKQDRQEDLLPKWDVKLKKNEYKKIEKNKLGLSSLRDYSNCHAVNLQEYNTNNNEAFCIKFI